MFDLSDPSSTRRRERASPIPPAPAVTAESAGVDKPSPLDEPESIEIFHRLLDAYTRELDRQEDNRAEQATDEDFFDSLQWTDTDAQTLEDRGQKPLVYNVISTTVNWVLGTERRGRSDYRILPRRKEDAKAAERKSQLLKYLSDCNRTPFERSHAFADAVKVGVGWLEDCYEDDGDEPIVSRGETWRNMLWDSAATRPDLSDARYIFRSKWADLDIMQAIFPERAGLLDMAASHTEPLVPSGLYGDEAMDRAELELERIGSAARLPNRYQRRRVRAIEGWFLKPAKITRMSGSMWGGELYDPRSRGHRLAVANGDGEAVERQGMRVCCALITINGLLWLGPSPYRHNRYPFTPIWGNKRGRDGLPYGLIRGLRGIQEDINKRAAKALYLISTRRTTVDEGAVDDMDELAEEVSRPDAFIVKKPGKEIRIEDGRELGQFELEIMSRSIAMIQQASGVTDENQGRRTNATSGIAIERRQTQGAMATTHYFDNLRYAFQVQGEKQLSLVEQFLTEEKAFRITDMRGKPEYVTVNDGLPENDIARSKADFVISEQDWRASMREAAAAELLELLGKLAPVNPQLVTVLLDLLVESMDIANREEIVRRIRQMTGMRDPDAEEPTPEELQQAKAKAQQAQLQQAMVEANLRKVVAEAMRAEMQAMAAQAEAVRANITSMGGSKRGAIDIAADAMSHPGIPAIAPAADEVLREAGFVSRNEKEQTAVHAAKVQQAQAAAAEQAQQTQQNQPQAATPPPDQPPQGE
jgi:hypothetical protein